MNGFPRFDLTGQVALVTGAARAQVCALSLLHSHAAASISLGMRDAKAGGSLARQIEGLGREVLAFHMDISKMEEISLFFFNDTATTEIYTLSLHDALPIYKAIYQQLLDYTFSP